MNDETVGWVHWSFCDSRFRRRDRLPSASAQEAGCVLFVYRVATWGDRAADPYPRDCQFDNRLQSLRNLDDHSDAVGGGGVFDLVFEVGREEGLDQLGTIGK